MSKPNIIYRDFGNENLDWVCYNDLEQLDDINKIPNILKYIHFNKEHPENYNIRLYKNLLENDLIEIRENGEWVKKNIKIMMPIIEQNIRKIIKIKYMFVDKEYEIKTLLREFLTS